MIIRLFIIGLFSLLPADPVGEIDFNPRLLRKEVSSIFKDKHFERTELKFGSSKKTGDGKFFEFKDIDGKKIVVYIGRVNTCRSGGCSNPTYPGNDLQYEFFDYFMIFNESKKVEVVRIFNYEASHGQEVTIRKWLDQFVGYDGNKPLRVGKEVDTISGATTTVNTLVDDVKERTFLLNKYCCYD